MIARAASVGPETVVLVEGDVALRPEIGRDAGMASREVEVHVRALTIVGPARDPGHSGGAGRRERSSPPRNSGSGTACSTSAGPSCSAT